MIQDYFEDVIIMDKITTNDSISGVSTAYVDGATIRAGIVSVNSSDAVRVAYQEGKKAMYTVVTDKSVALAVGDRLKLVSDGTVMTVRSSPADMSTPPVASAGMQFHQVRAEAITL